MSQIKDLSRLLLTTICGLPHAYSYCRGVSPHQNITSAEILFDDIVSFELTPSLARRSSGFAINKCWLRDIMWPNNKRKWPKTARQNLSFFQLAKSARALAASIVATAADRSWRQFTGLTSGSSGRINLPQRKQISHVVI